jgi:hypothetical protein
MLQGRIFQDAWNLLFFAIFAIVRARQGVNFD